MSQLQIINAKRQNTMLIKKPYLSEEGISEIESSCKYSLWIEQATLEFKRKLIELLNVRGKLASENEKR
jgi:hypothetical protein